jgi:AraC family transcriptional regulator
MINYRILERPAFEVIGKKVWIAGTEDSQAFGRFWEQCRAAGLLATFERLNGSQPGLQTNSITLGISRVEQDPAKREFFYMIAIEKPEDCPSLDIVEAYRVPATQWAVFECRGKLPEAIIEAEMFAFMEWLPASDFVHANAPEMEVYLPEDNYCEFWLPIKQKR